MGTKMLGQMSMVFDEDGGVDYQSECDQVIKEDDRVEPYKGRDQLETPLGVVRARAVSIEPLTPLDMFSGYDTMRIVTYSYGLSFIERLIDACDYRNVEIVFGAEHMVRMDVGRLVGEQSGELVSALSDHELLVEKVRGGAVRLWIADNGLLTHEKLYLLKNSVSGNTRVITGSANASGAAFDGSQGETYTLFDDDGEIYRYYENRFEMFKRLSSDVGKDCKAIIDENGNIDFEQIPLVKKVRRNGAVVIHDVSDEEAEVVRIIAEKKQAVKEAIGNIQIQPEKDGSIVLTVKKIEEGIRKRKADIEETRQKIKISENPKLIINYESNSVSFNGAVRNLNPAIETVRADLILLNRLFEGFSCFEQDRPVAPVYWKLMNYMFVGPFMSKLRYTAACLGMNKSKYFPGMCLVRGNSDAAKTQTANAFQMLMLGIIPDPPLKKLFTEAKMRDFRAGLRGIPVVFDDIAKSRFNNNGVAESIAKLYTDAKGITGDNPVNEPFFILTSNVAGAINRQTRKRMVVLDIDAKCPQLASMENEDRINQIISSMTTALYDAYCHEMLLRMDDLIAGVRRAGEEDAGPDVSDIFKAGSEILISLYNKAGVSLPDDFTVLTWRDMLLTSTDKAMDAVIDMWDRHPEIFTADRQRNELTIDLSTYSRDNQDYYLNMFTKESPDSWKGKQGISSEVIFKSLSAMEADLGVRFAREEQKGVMRWIKNIIHANT